MLNRRGEDNIDTMKGTEKQRQDAAGISRCMEEILGFLGTIAQKCLCQT